MFGDNGHDAPTLNYRQLSDDNGQNFEVTSTHRPHDFFPFEQDRSLEPLDIDFGDAAFIGSQFENNSHYENIESNIEPRGLEHFTYSQTYVPAQIYESENPIELDHAAGQQLGRPHIDTVTTLSADRFPGSDPSRQHPVSRVLRLTGTSLVPLSSREHRSPSPENVHQLTVLNDRERCHKCHYRICRVRLICKMRLPLLTRISVPADRKEIHPQGASNLRMGDQVVIQESNSTQIFIITQREIERFALQELVGDARSLDSK